MIDLKKLRENPERYQQKTKEKWIDIDFTKLLQLDTNARQLKKQIDELSHQRNTISKEIPQLQKQWEDTSDKIAKVKEIKNQLEEKENEYKEIIEEFNSMYLKIPNPALDDVPFWESDDENRVNSYVWEKPQFDFDPLPHYELLEKRQMLDQQRSAKVSWARFYYIRDGLVLLHMALLHYVVNKLVKKWFSPTLVPNLVREKSMLATGFFPAEENEIYAVNEWEDNLYLIWTSEVSLVAQHLDETIDKEKLPLRYIGYSPCYRREAGSYWKDTKWLIRLHQFEKVEMVSFVSPEDSEKEHQFLLDIEEEIYQELWIHYQKIDICTWDTGFHAAKKYDLEAWFPGQDTYKEITSCSNCTDFQARRANIKYKEHKEKDYLHTLNGTVISMRPLIAIVENFQTKDMKIKVPKVLQPYMGVEEI